MISSNLISNFISPPFEVSLDYWLLFLYGCTDAIIQLSKIDDLMKEEANNLREVIDALHLKHKEYVDGMTQKLVVAWNVMIPGRCRR